MIFCGPHALGTQPPPPPAIQLIRCKPAHREAGGDERTLGRVRHAGRDDRVTPSAVWADLGRYAPVTAAEVPNHKSASTVVCAITAKSGKGICEHSRHHSKCKEYRATADYCRLSKT